ncbi:hypothetical protein [Candidatus Leptofilum sp.]|uniref:hypothetical protein n=1 Tax=Candidatus Leptofilum sp. TaxID=3241576 RepID=UPI003B5AC8FC
MITLTAHNLNWITKDETIDLCAHGSVEFSIGDLVIVSPDDGNWCVSAAALHLLRTLSKSHTSESPVGDHLFPCCGHAMYQDEKSNDCFIVECPNGINFDVIHRDSDILIKTENGQEKNVSSADWKTSICAFSDQISDFYEKAKPKKPFDDVERRGFEVFQREWIRRRNQVELDFRK